MTVLPTAVIVVVADVTVAPTALPKKEVAEDSGELVIDLDEEPAAEPTIEAVIEATVAPTQPPLDAPTSPPAVPPAIEPTALPAADPITIDPLPGFEGQLAGSWVWQSTTQVFMSDGEMQVDTPATTGKNITLMFSPDQMVSIYENGVLVQHVAYDVRDENAEGAMLDIGSVSGWSYITGDELTISQAALDGPITVYTRAP